MSDDDVSTPNRTRSRGPNREARPRAKIIDQEGREIPDASLRPQFETYSFDFGSGAANPLRQSHPRAAIGAAGGDRKTARRRLHPARHQYPLWHRRADRVDPVVGDLITTAISLWLVREARALGAPWRITARMLANVALDGAVGMVPLAGDAFGRHVPRQCAQCPIAQALDGEAIRAKHKSPGPASEGSCRMVKP